MKTTLPYAREALRKYWPAMIIGAIATIVAISMTKYIIIGALLFLHAAMSVFTKVLKKNHIGIEIVTLIAVTSGIAYGPKIGAIAGGLAMVIDYIFSGRLSMFSIVTIPTYALIGVIASGFATANILTLGIALTIFYNLFTWIFILGFMGGHVDKCLRFGATNLAFNTFMFGSIAPMLLAIMS
ncbi:hypothetical protein HYY74_03305 [Candidatus Woesearchaeota archaeon]|nr:hypothetical protein [Candidatus Woesearchaeota archaeon]